MGEFLLLANVTILEWMEKSIAIHQIMEFPFHGSSPQTNRRDILVVTDGYKVVTDGDSPVQKTPVHWN